MIYRGAFRVFLDSYRKCFFFTGNLFKKNYDVDKWLLWLP